MADGEAKVERKSLTDHEAGILFGLVAARQAVENQTDGALSLVADRLMVNRRSLVRFNAVERWVELAPANGTPVPIQVETVPVSHPEAPVS